MYATLRSSLFVSCHTQGRFAAIVGKERLSLNLHRRVNIGVIGV